MTAAPAAYTARRARSERWRGLSGRGMRTRPPRSPRPVTVAELWRCVLVGVRVDGGGLDDGRSRSCGQLARPGPASRPGIARVRTVVARGPRLRAVGRRAGL